MIFISTPAIVVMIVILTLLLVIARVLMLRKSSGSQTTQAPVYWGSNKLPIDWEAFADEVLQRALNTGDRIRAVKRYHELTGVALNDALDIIDYAVLHPDERGDKKKKATYDAQDAGIRDLITDGRMNEAIEIYQKFAGVDAYTARDAVEAIANDLHLSDNAASRSTFESPTSKSNRN